MSNLNLETPSVFWVFSSLFFISWIWSDTFRAYVQAWWSEYNVSFAVKRRESISSWFSRGDAVLRYESCNIASSWFIESCTLISFKHISIFKTWIAQKYISEIYLEIIYIRMQDIKMSCRLQNKWKNLRNDFFSLFYIYLFIFYSFVF